MKPFGIEFEERRWLWLRSAAWGWDFAGRAGTDGGLEVRRTPTESGSAE